MDTSADTENRESSQDEPHFNPVFEERYKELDEIIPKEFDDSLEELLQEIYSEIKNIDYWSELKQSTKEGFQGFEIINHPKLCYLKNQCNNICKKIFEELVSCSLVKEHSETNLHDFIVSNKRNDDIILFLSSDGSSGVLSSIRLVFCDKLLKRTTEGRNNLDLLIIHKKLPEGVNYVSRKYNNVKPASRV